MSPNGFDGDADGIEEEVEDEEEEESWAALVEDVIDDDGGDEEEKVAETVPSVVKSAARVSSACGT